MKKVYGVERFFDHEGEELNVLYGKTLFSSKEKAEQLSANLNEIFREGTIKFFVVQFEVVDQ